MRIVPVVMCGGGGARLWPTSRPSHPKQFLRLLGSLSLFQDTVRRLSPQPGILDPVIVAGAAHEGWLCEQLGEIGQSATLLLEPAPRDSGPAVAAAALHVAAHHPDAVVVILASDHHVPSPEAFRSAVLEAVDLALDGHIVTLGVRPDAASSAYGYIRPGARLREGSAGHAVERFVEKPDPAAAERYLQDGYLWNSGNFVAPAALLVEELRRHCPAVLAQVKLALDEATDTGPVRRLSASFREAPKIAFDYAVMEKTQRAAVLPVEFAWSDLGSWDAVHAAGDRDDAGNAVAGAAVLIDTSGSVVRVAPGMFAATVGVKNLAVIVERDAVLVCALDSAQGVKTVVERVGELGWPRSFAPPGEVEADLSMLSRKLDDWLDVSALPLWWSLGADHQNGGFHESLSLIGRPVGGDRRARVQMRQAFVYAGAGAAGWSGPWQQAMEHGLSYLEGRYRRPDGLFRSVVDACGRPVDDTAMLYDQAFGLLAWANATHATARRSFDAKANQLLAGLNARRCPAGGFLESGDRPNQSNPHMHLLEAALAWVEAGGAPCWERLAREIVALALNRFVDPRGGYLREFFDPEWRPSPGDLGRKVEPGHQFEWAWLLARWSMMSGDREALEVAKALFKHGVAGVDLQRGVAVDAVDDAFQVSEAQARLWPQTERLKAAVLLMELDPSGAATYQVQAVAAARSLLRYLEAPVPGVWRDKLSAEGRWQEEPAPASSLYHIACAVWELRRTQSAARGEQPPPRLREALGAGAAPPIAPSWARPTGVEPPRAIGAGLPL